jgi:uncharacterized protein YbjT (DUF2867 family)
VERNHTAWTPWGPDNETMTAPAARVAIAGAGGFVGTRLAHHLGAHHPVLALGRTLAKLPDGPGIERRSVDVSDVDDTADALRDVKVAYYLVHAMAGGDDFAERDREFARSFVAAAAKAGVERIVYLGGLGQGSLSAHLASRQEVGEILAAGGVDTVELRAAVILGSGSISFEMLRYLTERLPAMICPRWVDSLLNPLAERDLLAYLAEAAAVPSGVYEIGGPEPVSYTEMMQAYARVRGLRRRRILRVPLLTPRLSAHWVDFVTPVDRAVSHSLIESLTNDVVVTERERTDAVFTVRPLGVEDALRRALDEQEERLEETIFEQADGLTDGVYAFRSHAPLNPEARHGAELDLHDCGGDLRWYGLAWAWRARLLLGRFFGERLSLHHPDSLDRDERVDWWTVREHGETVLVLATHSWFCGEAWLAYRTVTTPRSELQQVGALRAKGLPGWIYWRALWPIHLVVFRRMAQRQAQRAHAIAGE